MNTSVSDSVRWRLRSSSLAVAFVALSCSPPVHTFVGEAGGDGSVPPETIAADAGVRGIAPDAGVRIIVPDAGLELRTTGVVVHSALGSSEVVYPEALALTDNLVVVGGTARSPFSFGSNIVNRGGFVLAFDRSAVPQWARSLGEGSTVEALVAGPQGLFIAGSFNRDTTLGPAVSGTISLTRRGPTQPVGSPSDGFVVRLTRDGLFEWARGVGSDGYDGLRSLTLEGERLVAGGTSRGDVSAEGCLTTVAGFPGEVDPVEGGLIGTEDGLLVSYDTSGACVSLLLLGREGHDDEVGDVALRQGSLVLSGSSVLPVLLRRSSSPDLLVVDRPPRIRNAAWLVAFDPMLTPTLAVASSEGGRGRGLGLGADEVRWMLESGSDQTLGWWTGSAPLPLGAALVSLTPSAVEVVTLGRESSGTWRSSTFASSTWVTAMVGGGFTLGLVSEGRASTVRIDAISGFAPLVAAGADGIWLAGYSVRPFQLGAQRVDVGETGGLYLARLERVP